MLIIDLHKRPLHIDNKPLDAPYLFYKQTDIVSEILSIRHCHAVINP